MIVCNQLLYKCHFFNTTLKSQTYITKILCVTKLHTPRIQTYTSMNLISIVTVSIFTSKCGSHGFEPRSGQTKDYKMVFVASPLTIQH